jgi:hypothetical protein
LSYRFDRILAFLIYAHPSIIRNPAMTIEEIQFIARQIGLAVEQQPIGFCLRDRQGRVIASHLPRDQIEDMVQNMALSLAIQTNMATVAGQMH